MKKLYLLIILSLLGTAGLSADTASEIQKIVERFSVQFKNANPDLVFRPNLGIMPFKNEAPDAEKHRIGEAVTGLVENNFSRSLIFNVIDEKKREQLIKEMKFALSGMADAPRIDPGKMEGIDYFIYGSVTQLGENFSISLKAVEVVSGKMIFSGDASIPKYDIIDYSEKLAAAYVSPYGLGIEFHMTPYYLLNSRMSEIEGQITEGWPFGFTINYRINRNLVTWLGYETTTGAFRLEDTFENKTYLQADIENMDKGATGFPTQIMYKKERTYGAASIGLGYVLNFTRKFNITLGGEMKLGMSFLQQFYDFDNLEHKIESNDMTMLLACPGIKLQYFITPRVALNVGYNYGFQLGEQDKAQYSYAGTAAQTVFPQLYDLDPAIGPDGKPHVTDFSGHRIIAGFGFYF